MEMEALLYVRRGRCYMTTKTSVGERSLPCSSYTSGTVSADAFSTVCVITRSRNSSQFACVVLPPTHVQIMLL